MDTLFSQFLDETGKKTLWLTVALCVKQVAKKSQLSPLPNWASSLSSPRAISPIGRWLESEGQKNPWFVYPMNRIIFQPDETPMVPIFHHSIVPLFSASGG